MTPELTALEHALWRSETRFDRALMEATLAPDCHEFGRSGRRYTRAEMLSGPAGAGPIDATLHDLTVAALAPGLSLVTYVSELRGGATEWANRASVWDRTSGRWQLRFHQGTPCEALT